MSLNFTESGSVPIIVRLICAPDDKIADQAVWAISNIAGENNLLRDEVVKAGVLPQLEKLLHRQAPANDSVSNIIYFAYSLR